MAPWLIPTIRALLPHIGTIITATKPMFTKKTFERTLDPGTNPDNFVQQQIAELQSAAVQNAENIKQLAEQLQRTVTALEQTAVIAQTRLQRTLIFCVVASALSVGAAIIALLQLS